MKDARRAAMRESMGETAKSDPTKGKSNSYLNLPGDIEKWTINEKKTYLFDIISYYNEVDAPAASPIKIVNKKDKERNFTYYRPYLRHSINRRSFVCPKTFGKDCPACDAADKLRKNYDENKIEYNNIKAKARSLYNVLIDGEIKVWDVSDAHFEKELRKEYEEDENNRDFAFLDDGLSVKVRFVKSDYSDKYFQPDRIDFVKRDDIDPTIIDEIADLNKVLVELDRDEILKIMNDVEEEEEDYVEEEAAVEEQPTARKKPADKAPAKEEVEEEEESTSEEPEDDSWNDEGEGTDW